ncbi:glutaredoxin-C15-like [Lolium rigidum]|uniref:glutaredoxin-C15-like n=1 Tax=Lolium rigidum TaxID=89674 RepID=UPI001F5CBC50|nr:glutaredoxin-C15-like [Lolium rigidum]
MERVTRLTAEEAVVIFAASNGCPTNQAVTTLFSSLGVCAAVHELDKDPCGRELEHELACASRHWEPSPVVFIGGKLVGSTNTIMSLHLSGKLVPLLKDAGAM